MEQNSLKTVALIGRPNVGKSTLFNRLVGKRIAIETPIPGTTRDRLFGIVNWGNESFNLIDVAGIELGAKKEIDRSTQEAVQLAIENADLILFVVDWNDKDNELDKAIARKLRPLRERVIMVVNKSDNIERSESIEEFKRLGLPEIQPVSGISGKSSGDLLDVVIARLKLTKSARAKEKRIPDIHLAVIGRPNVGKSTLLNSIVGEKRAVVSEEAGTTRDIIDVEFNHKGKSILISDTAGIRRPGKVQRDTIESFSVIRSYKALKNCTVAVLVIDATEGLVALDANILGKAKEWGKGIVLAVNKTDLIEEDKSDFMARTLERLQITLNFVPWLPVVFISAKDEDNINFLLNQVIVASENRNRVVDQKTLDMILEQAKNDNPQLAGIHKLKQKKNAPPIFEALYGGKSTPHYTQLRYLENRIRDNVSLTGTPVYIDLKKS